ncbi:hypothetical protein BKA62DRAFT_671157 [Auriculariales sp. MPI-PUGE-AT-0066]|nr:hypothetical protein BKA62DRAFT_671157 [Auriculariales sp. MPI-PUGE-AT-0066]
MSSETTDPDMLTYNEMHASIGVMLVELTTVRNLADALPDVGEDNEGIASIVSKINNVGLAEFAVFHKRRAALQLLREGKDADAELLQVTSDLKTKVLHACFRAVRSTWNDLERDIAFLRDVEDRLVGADDGDMVPFTPKAEDTDVDAEAYSDLDVGGTMEASAEVVSEVEGDSDHGGRRSASRGTSSGTSRRQREGEGEVSGGGVGARVRRCFWRKAAEGGHRVPVSAGDMFGDESALTIVGGSDGLVGHWPCERCTKRGAARPGSGRRSRGVKRSHADISSEEEEEDEEGGPSSSKEHPSKVCKAKVVAEGQIRAVVQAEDRSLLEVVESAARSLASIAGSLVDHGLVLHRIADTLTEQQKTTTSLARSVYAMRKMLRRVEGAGGAGAPAGGAGGAGAPTGGAGGAGAPAA